METNVFQMGHIYMTWFYTNQIESFAMPQRKWMKITKTTTTKITETKDPLIWLTIGCGNMFGPSDPIVAQQFH